MKPENVKMENGERVYRCTWRDPIEKNGTSFQSRTSKTLPCYDCAGFDTKCPQYSPNLPDCVWKGSVFRRRASFDEANIEKIGCLSCDGVKEGCKQYYPKM